jgi:hypothetical protein
VAAVTAGIYISLLQKWLVPAQFSALAVYASAVGTEAHVAIEAKPTTASQWDGDL